MARLFADQKETNLDLSIDELESSSSLGPSDEFRSKYMFGADEFGLPRPGLDEAMGNANGSVREIRRGQNEVEDLRTAAHMVATRRVAAGCEAKDL